MREKYANAIVLSQGHGRLFGSLDILEWCLKGLCFPSFRGWEWYGSVSDGVGFEDAIVWERQQHEGARGFLQVF